MSLTLLRRGFTVVRQYRIVHERMLLEWLMRTYPPGSWTTNVRLGMPHPEVARVSLTPEERRMLWITLPMADAVVLLPDRVDIIECLVRPEWWKILMLKVYGKLFPMTEEFRPHWGKPINLVLVTAILNPFMEWVAREETIRVIHYRPIWIDQYYAGLMPRKRLPPKIKLPKGEGSP